ncbi:cytochrome c biogenesis protein CcsA [Crateriforma spongiae]|uniref:cytochrome c biogenesis protein CcsA n=1 Tax=Crateriforma spongiae TaxID=2724528 RepID=UPI0014477DD6|nr:cytochrome c biogenesis protein CcsA [Crateriforma spongiae]
MLDFLSEISVICFASCYLLALLLELSRLIGRYPGRGIAVLALTIIGLLTQLAYLTLRATGSDGGDELSRLATWMDWSLLTSFGLAVCFLVMYLRRPDTVISFFFLPAILLLIGLAAMLRNQPPFTRSEAFEIWRTVHAIGMAAGSAAVTVGFLSGLMYLFQSRRLKQKRAGSTIRLPDLETLQRLSRGCLLTSLLSVGVGVLAGVVMNLNRWGQVGWTDGGVLFSGALFLWLLIASIVEMLYAPARRGHKVAYLTLASFGFLVLAMFGVLGSPHGEPAVEPGPPAVGIHTTTPIDSIVVGKFLDQPEVFLR